MLNASLRSPNVEINLKRTLSEVEGCIEGYSEQIQNNFVSDQYITKNYHKELNRFKKIADTYNVNGNWGYL